MCLKTYGMSHKWVFHFTIILYLLSSFGAFGQTDSTSIPYYVDINNYFNVSVDLETNFETFNLTGDGFEFDIRPNFDFINKAGIDYRAFSFFFSFTPQLQANSDENLKGKSTHKGFGFSFNSKKLINHVSTSNVKGFYLANSGDFDLNFIQGVTPYTQFEGLKVTSFRGFHAFKLNANFSYGAFSAQMALQKRSAGTLAPGISYNYYRVENTNAQNSKNLELLLNLPYYYTHVLHQKWYLNIGVIPGIGRVHTLLTTPTNGTSIESTSNSMITRVSGVFGLGYNSKGLFAGVEGQAHKRYQSRKDNSVKEKISSFAFRLFLGFHICAPKFVNRTYDKVESRFMGK